jgi:hypothetical protein
MFKWLKFLLYKRLICLRTCFILFIFYFLILNVWENIQANGVWDVFNALVWAWLNRITNFVSKLPTLNWPECSQNWIELNQNIIKTMSYYISSLYGILEQLLWMVCEHWKLESFQWMSFFSKNDCQLQSENTHRTF